MNLTVVIPDDVIATRLKAEAGGDLSRRALEALLAEEYRHERLTKPELQRLLGIETSYELDGFLKSHDVWIEYTREDADVTPEPPPSGLLMFLVVADTSPVFYLLSIGQIELLPCLFTSVFVPDPVHKELSHATAPAVLREWTAERPLWLKVMPVDPIGDAALQPLGAGERAAITLALSMHADTDLDR